LHRERAYLATSACFLATIASESRDTNTKTNELLPESPTIKICNLSISDWPDKMTHPNSGICSLSVEIYVQNGFSTPLVQLLSDYPEIYLLFFVF
jgi:hypothetical protein